jgi:hypothetical protein
MFIYRVSLDKNGRFLVANDRRVKLAHHVQTPPNIAVMFPAFFLVEFVRINDFGESAPRQEDRES